MRQFSYNTSPALRFHLRAFDELRRTLLTTPVSPKQELRLQWDALVDTLHGMFLLGGYPYSKKDISETIASPIRSDSRALIGSAKAALTMIRQDWVASEKPISTSAISSFVGVLFPKTLGLYQRGFRQSEDAIKRLLDYIDNPKEHPLIRAAIGYEEILSLGLFPQDSTLLATVLFELIVAKSGYDARGYFAISATWASDNTTYQATLDTAVQSANLTAWLEYVGQSAVSELERFSKKLTSTSHEMPAAFFDLNDRQKGILSILMEPERKITNKEVQKRFKISQITASRDLAKLAVLGLIYPHGKGRSVSYTRV